AAGGRAGVVVMHTELDQELLDEGLAREVLARIQARRKQLDLGYTDRIKVTLRGDARVREVVAVRHDHIEREALCDDVVLDETTIADELESGWEGAEVQGSRFAFLVES
ncbi:MAG: hypothetical protein KC731_03775, partial [Myxococcales bacterium]|nr:hypothetical protein [Myxococcales bacterium]